jgi:four helix bundle protein
MTETELKQRTKAFALRGLKLIDSLPETRSSRVVANQLGWAGTPVGANYRAAGRSRSTAGMISKISVVEEEADEPGFWMELTVDHGLMSPAKVSPLPREADELTAITVASRKTLLAHNRESRIQNRKSP